MPPLRLSAGWPCWPLLNWLLAGLLLVGPVQAQQPTARRVVLDFANLRQQLSAPAGTARAGQPAPTYRLVLPTLAAAHEEFVLSETHVLPATDAAARRRLRTFVGYAPADPARTVSLVLRPGSVHADLLGGPAPATLAADPAGGYRLRPAPPVLPGACGVPDAWQRSAASAGSKLAQPAPYSFGSQARTLQLAILVTLEYYNAHGGNDADVEADVVTAINSITARYLVDLSVTWQLVRPLNEPTYYFSAMTTGTLSNGAAAQSGRVRAQRPEDVHPLTVSRFGSANFDIGHCFHNTGGGVAYVGVLCSSSAKGGGFSGVPDGSGFQQVLAHELGHQLGAVHTFSGNCGSYGAASQVEPGAGATIMAYPQVGCAQTLSGITGSNDYSYFNALSLRQMRNGLTAATCPTTTASANQVPTVNAGADYTIPKGTPFVLTASGSDPDGNTLRYTWDQADYSDANLKALGTTAGDGGLAAVDDPEAPLFRSQLPRLANSRTFPAPTYVLNNDNQPANLVGEALSNVTRDIHFTVTVRDNVSAGGAYATDNVTVHVNAGGGPFRLTVQNSSPGGLWIAGQPATITWDVAGTTAAPFSTSQVRLLLSTDGGSTFPTVLATLANDGSESVTIPAGISTSRARLRLEAVGNVYFDINNADFPIGPCQPADSQLLPATALTAPAGDASLNLSELPFSTTQYTQLTGTITNADPAGPIALLSSGNCTQYSDAPHYEATSFVPATTGSYTLNRPTSFSNMVLRLYADSFAPGSPCVQLIGQTLNAPLTASLTAGRTYVVVVSNYQNPVPSGANYRLTFTGGNVYAPLADDGYDYQYAVVNKSSGTVVRLDAAPDLRGLPAGTYEVRGMLFQRGYDVSARQGASYASLQAALAAVAPCGQLSTNLRTVTITPGQPLPVTLTSFTGQPRGVANQLRWQTASEQRVAYFAVERSLDSRQFAELSRVPARNAPQGATYNYLDPAPPALAYYRLRVQEADSTAHYSPVVAVSRPEASGFTMTAYPTPTPVGTPVQVLLQSPVSQVVELQLLDVVGRQVLRRVLSVPAGTTLLTLPEAAGRHGVCYLFVKPAEDNSLRHKLLLE